MKKLINFPVGNQDLELRMIEKYLANLYSPDIRIIDFGVSNNMIDCYLGYHHYAKAPCRKVLDFGADPIVYMYDYANITVRNWVRKMPSAYYGKKLMKFEMIYPNAKVKSLTLMKWSI